MNTPTPSPRRILVLGGGGFIGRHVVQHLQAQGHQVRVGVRHAAAGDIAVDMRRDLRPEDWMARLVGVDVVINTVGVLRSADIAAIHHHAPVALFEACARAGVPRVLQLSALGIDGVDRPYATTKRAADEHLWRMTDAGRLAGVVVRPSLVLGPGGASTQLFQRMAQCPVLPLPRLAFEVLTQPIAVHHLAALMARLATAAQPPHLLNAVGPDPLTVAELVARLRAQAHRRPARLIQLPDAVAQLSARLADGLPFTPWGMDTLSLLQHHPTVDAGPTHQWLGQRCPSALNFEAPT